MVFGCQLFSYTLGCFSGYLIGVRLLSSDAAVSYRIKAFAFATDDDDGDDEGKGNARVIACINGITDYKEYTET